MSVHPVVEHRRCTLSLRTSQATDVARRRLANGGLGVARPVYMAVRHARYVGQWSVTVYPQGVYRVRHGDVRVPDHAGGYRTTPDPTHPAAHPWIHRLDPWTHRGSMQFYTISGISGPWWDRCRTVNNRQSGVNRVGHLPDNEG